MTDCGSWYFQFELNAGPAALNTATDNETFTTGLNDTQDFIVKTSDLDMVGDHVIKLTAW